MHRLLASSRRILVHQGTFLAILAMLLTSFPMEFATAATLAAPQVTLSNKNDVSPPLTQITPPTDDKQTKEKKLRKVPRPTNPNATTAGVQNTPASVSAPATTTNFDGIGNGVAGFTVQSAPPDTNGAVGPNHYVQSVNSDFAVYNKTGSLLFGPVAINTLWSGFGGLCQTDNDGDPVVMYDRMADRWFIAQFAITGANGTTTPFLQCVAVSTTADPTGSYNRYSFNYANFPDYPKFGVWPDGYYFTTNEFNAAGTTFLGARIGVFDRSKMLAGQPASQITFANTSTSYGGILPATLDSSTQPPAGSPNWVVGLGATPGSTLAYWKVQPNFTTPSSSTLVGPTEIGVTSYAEACNGGTCIPQGGTTQQLDSLADRMMYRLAYRNFGDHEAMVVDHSVTAGSSTGMRWYELRPNAGALTVYQQGTYAPDANYRWMGSIAMDKAGDMAMGFNLSSSTTHPAIAYTGRLVGDALGNMGQGERIVITGGGSQTGTSTLSRWGDYSTMTIDPSDDCTFWYTTEYIPSNGTFNWRTRIASFKFPSCGTTTNNDFSISASPNSLSLTQNASGTSTISTAVTSGTAQAVSLTVSGVPAGATASLNPTSVTAGGSSTLTVNSGTAAVGTYTLTVTGTEGSATHSTTVGLTVSASTGSGGITNGGFETGNLSGWTSAGTTSVVSSGAHSGTYAAKLGATTATNGDSSVAQTFTAPTGTTGLSFWYKVTCPDTVTYDWATATLKDNTSNTTSTVLAKTCANSAWTQVTAAITAGHSYTLNMISHDDNYASDPTYTLFDDVTLTGSSVAGGVTNGGFEIGNLTGWTSAGTTSVVSSGAHSGTYAAQVGATTATNGDSSVSQTFTVPTGKSQLSIWYKITCPDTVTYDWATITLKNNSSNTTTTVLAKTCGTTAWTNVTATISAGTSYTLTLVSHDDNYASDATYTLYDDITLN